MMNRIGDQGLSDMFMFPLKGKIESLSLDVTSNKLHAQAFENFTYYLASVPSESLTNFEILVRGNRIEENGTFAIARTLKRFTKLESLKIDTYFNNLKTKGVKPIALLLRFLPSLKILDLNFDLNYIETEGGKLIGTAIRGLVGL